MVTLTFVEGFDNELYISENIRDSYNISDNTLQVHFGHWSRKMKIVTDKELSKDTIGLPIELKETYTIPTDLPYELVMDEDQMLIGPVIAYVVTKFNEKLTLKLLKKIKPRLHHYNNINGLIYACAAEGFDTKDKIVHGMYYNPHATNHNDQWIAGTFPYPASMYKRVALQDELYEDFKEIGLEDKIFNLNYFNKWELFEAFSSHDEVKQYVPETRRLNDFSDIKEMTRKYSTVYLKPMAGMLGKGIYAIQTTKKEMKIVDREKQTHCFKNMKQAKKFFNRYINIDEGYLVQQGVATTYRKQHVDFRLYMQKDASMEWTCSGVVGRFARKRSIITNIKFVQDLLYGEEAVQKLFNVNSEEANEIVNQMVNAGLDIAQHLDKEIGHFGDVAIDMIIDKNRNIWLLEVNNRIYGTKSLQYLNDFDRYYKIKSMPLEYAKALSGFGRK